MEPNTVTKQVRMRSLFAGMVTLVALVMGGSLTNQIFAAGANSSKNQLETTTFGPIGISAGQTLRLSAVRTFDGKVQTVCGVDLSIFDFQGNQQREVSQNLKPGQGAVLDLAWTDVAPPPSGAQTQLNAIIDLTRIPEDGEPSCHVASSIEVFDQASGHVLVYQDAPSETFDVSRMPQPNVLCIGPCARSGPPCPDRFDCWCDPKSKANFICCDARPAF